MKALAWLEQNLHSQQSRKVFAKLEGSSHTWQELLHTCWGMLHKAGEGLARLAGPL